jgi:ribosome-binding factor A
MTEGLHEERLKKLLLNAVNIYLSRRADEFGFCYAEAIVLANDSRSARILIAGPKGSSAKKAVASLKEHKSDLNEIFRNSFSVRFIPRLIFIYDEKTDI